MEALTRRQQRSIRHFQILLTAQRLSVRILYLADMPGRRIHSASRRTAQLASLGSEKYSWQCRFYYFDPVS